MVEQSRVPSRREIIRPWELIIGAALASAFAGIILFAGTRDWAMTVIVVGLLFIVTMVSLAMCVLAVKPKRDELDDLDEQNLAD